MNRFLALSAIIFLLVNFACNRAEQDQIHELPEDFNSKEQQDLRINSLIEDIENDKSNDVLYYKLAQCYIEQKKVSSAYPHLLKALELKPENTSYALLLTFCLYKSGLYHDALDYLLKIRDKIPEDQYINLATEIYFNTGKYEEALVFINELLTEEPRNVALIVKKGIITSTMGDTVNAINLYERAMAVDSSATSPLIQLSTIYLIQKKYADAKELLVKAIKSDSTITLANYNLGLTYKNLEKKDSAIYYYEKAIQYDSSHVNSLYNVSILYLQNQSYDKAIVYLKKITHLKSDIPNLDYKIAVALLKLNRKDEALLYFEKIDTSNINYNFAQKSIKEITTKRKSTAVVEQSTN